MIATIASLGISAGALIVALVIGVLGVKHNGNVDMQERVRSETKRAADMASIQVTLSSINADTSDIRAEQRGIRETMTDISKRLTIVEESAKSAHKRIDRLDHLISVEHDVESGDRK